jgi:membrane protease YdiL (CAAX protease family)
MLLPLVWAACAVAGCIYALHQNIPWSIALKALPAFLLEATFFYALGVEKVRARIEKLPSLLIGLGLIAAALSPYCVVALAFGTFRWHAIFWIAGLAAADGFWYLLLPRTPASDIVFLAFNAVVWLSRVLIPFYPRPLPRLPLEALAQAMWFRTGLFAMVSIRRPPGVGFGFWPKLHEWRIGLLYFLAFLPPAVAVAWWTRFGRPHMPANTFTWTSFAAVATFFGTLWVLALGEEFFFRGLLQQWMTAWLHNQWAGWIVASAVFASAHLWYHAFPNWKMSAMALLLGLCCGLAFRQARSIRAPMVTHALVVTTWRLFFS